MEKIIYFDNKDKKYSLCSGKLYYEFLDYAFSESDYFMLVYVNYNENGFTKCMKLFREKLKSFEVKCRSNPSWPGTLNTYSQNTTYKVIFYKNCIQAREILKTVTCLNDWSRPYYPQDLAFFKGNQCWFFSVGHENIAAIIHATDKDIDFVESRGLAQRVNVRELNNNYFNAYNENLES